MSHVIPGSHRCQQNIKSEGPSFLCHSWGIIWPVWILRLRVIHCLLPTASHILWKAEGYAQSELLLMGQMSQFYQCRKIQWNLCSGLQEGRLPFVNCWSNRLLWLDAWSSLVAKRCQRSNFCTSQTKPKIQKPNQHNQRSLPTCRLNFKPSYLVGKHLSPLFV